jgi:hypothetical protein
MIFRIARTVARGASRGPGKTPAKKDPALFNWPLGLLTLPLVTCWPLLAWHRGDSRVIAMAAWLGLAALLAALTWVSCSKRRPAGTRHRGALRYFLTGRVPAGREPGPYRVTWALAGRSARRGTAAGQLGGGHATRAGARLAACADAGQSLSWTCAGTDDIAMVKCGNGSVIAYRVKYQPLTRVKH